MEVRRRKSLGGVGAGLDWGFSQLRRGSEVCLVAEKGTGISPSLSRLMDEGQSSRLSVPLEIQMCNQQSNRNVLRPS